MYVLFYHPLTCKWKRAVLLRFSKTRELWSSKATFTVTFFATVNQNYDHKQRTLKHRNTQNGSKSTNQKPWPFKSIEVNFWGLLRWSTGAKNGNVSWLLNFTICAYEKCSKQIWTINTLDLLHQIYIWILGFVVQTFLWVRNSTCGLISFFLV